MVNDENQPFEANLKAIAYILHNLSVVDESISITTDLKKAKDFLVYAEIFFRRIKYGTRLVPHIEIQTIILKGLHDELGHWDFNTTYSFVIDRFWWPNMRQEVASFVKSCDNCHKSKPTNRKALAGKISISGLSWQDC